MTRSTRNLTTALFVGVAAALLNACGGGGSSESGSDFVAQAEAICASPAAKPSPAEAQQLAAKVRTNPDQAGLLYAQQSLRPLRAIAGKIGRLTPPPGKEQALHHFVASVNSATARFQQNPGQLIAAASAGQNPFPELQPLVAELGLQKCFPAHG